MSYTYLSSIQFQFLLRLKISRGICPFFPYQLNESKKYCIALFFCLEEGE